LESAFYRVVDSLDDETASFESVPDLLRTVCSLYDLKSAAYFGVNLSGEGSEEPLLAVTYSSEWVAHYKIQIFVDIDPVISKGFSSLRPIVWSAYDARTTRLKRFFGEAAEFGIGKRGLTIPIRGRNGDRALFTITSDQNLVDWSGSQKRFERDFQMLAFHLHQRILKARGVERPAPKLAPRELECLKWRAAGKCNWSTAQIMGISAKTVACYLETARVKLNASNTTHAIAKAMSYNLFAIAH